MGRYCEVWSGLGWVVGGCCEVWVGVVCLGLFELFLCFLERVENLGFIFLVVYFVLGLGWGIDLFEVI